MNDMIFLNKSVISSKQQRVCWMFISTVRIISYVHRVQNDIGFHG